MSDARRRGRGYAVAVVVAALAFGAAACGSSDSAATTADADYVTAKRVDRYPPGTPQRTVMEWWKAVQFANPSGANSYYAPHRSPGLPVLQHRLAIASNQFSGIPVFDSAKVDGKRATVYFFWAHPGTSAPARAVSVNLMRTGKGWGLADDQLLGQVVERVESASRPAAPDGRSS
jgi:hypothetical protein